VANSRKPATGKFLEQIGSYDPNQRPPTIKIDEARAIYWLSNGAQLSDTVHSIFRHTGVMEKFEQVKAGKPLEEATASVIEWPKNKRKIHKKKKEKAAADAEEASKAPAPESGEKTGAKAKPEAAVAQQKENPVQETEAASKSETKPAADVIKRITAKK
jgi:small subunit ribosomal protein S16